MASTSEIPLSPPPGTPQIVADRQGVFAEISSRTPLDERFKADFISSRKKMVESHPALTAPLRSKLLRDLDIALPSESRGTDTARRPVPGGVGYGMFYSPNFRSAFAEGTGIYWEVVAPAQPGGNVSSSLYLTATNRAAMGVEALVGYSGQSSPTFLVFDWARYPSAPWQTKIPISTLGSYLKQETISGRAVPVLPIMNTTYLTAPQTWVNQVSFPNWAAHRWDLVYQFSYQASLSQQLAAWPGTWGPIVEIFQEQYQGTNEMGALKTILSTRANGAWGTWAALVPNQAQLTGPNAGFTADYLDPNASWLVHS